jgi:sortase (surface protein transpeptidase)
VGAALVCVTACGSAGAAPSHDSVVAGSTMVNASNGAANSSPIRPSTPSGAPAPSSAAPGPASTSAQLPSTNAEASAAPAALVLPASAPVFLSVPAIGITSPLIDLGRNADGTVEVPSLDDPDSKPGWYRNSPSPGTLGPAIILGHVDSRQFGPGVFYSLQDLQQGDGIDVTRADGTVAQFTIDSVQTVAKSDFPTLEVYGNLDHAGLRLITCGGEFDPNAHSYESNIIVFASLVGSRAA